MKIQFSKCVSNLFLCVSRDPSGYIQLHGLHPYPIAWFASISNFIYIHVDIDASDANCDGKCDEKF